MIHYDVYSIRIDLIKSRPNQASVRDLSFNELFSAIDV